MRKFIDRLSATHEESGQTMAEYGVVLALITLAVIGAMTMLSNNLNGAFSSVANMLP